MYPAILVKFCKLTPESPIPTSVYQGDAGIDLHISGGHSIPSNTSLALPTGISIQIPEGYYGRIVGRSSTLFKKNLIVLEGIIDSGYRGEVKIMVRTLDLPTKIDHAESIAQLIIQPLTPVKLELTSQLSSSERGENGFGSSGNGQNRS